MSDWEFEENEVVEDSDGRWWHITQRLVDVDSDKWNRYYSLWDATHTEQNRAMNAEDVGSMYDRTGIVCKGKPAAKHGYRVNGVLCGPSDVDHWLGKECLHDHECPSCESDGMRDIDVIVDHAESVTRYLCRECEHEVQVSNE